jgi:hypothetical protein
MPAAEPASEPAREVAEVDPTPRPAPEPEPRPEQVPSGASKIAIPESGPHWPFLNRERTAAHWVAPLAATQAQAAPTYNELRAGRAAATSTATPVVNREPLTPPAPVETPSPSHTTSMPGPAEPPQSHGAPLTTAAIVPDVLTTPPVRERDLAPEASVVETAPAVSEPTMDPTTEPATEPTTVSEEPDGSPVRSAPSRLRRALIAVVTLVWIAAVAVSAGRLAEAHDLWSQPENVTRMGAVVATWLAIVVLARRCGGRSILIGVFAGVVLGLVTAYPEDWALAGAGVTAATVHGVLGMTLTRPAKGLRPLREMLVSALIGAAGAVVVTGYDVMLRPFRFRIMVLTLVLLAGFALAWRLGQGVGSLGRRGLVLIGGGVLVLALSIAYSQAIRAWGSPGVVSSVSDLVDTLEARLGAVPRPIEALVGFPALVWGVATRTRRRQGWWMCAFGALGAAGVATSLIQPTTPFVDSITATGYDLVIGGLLGLVLIGLDRLATGRGRRAATMVDDPLERPEPARFAPLM